MTAGSREYKNWDKTSQWQTVAFVQLKSILGRSGVD